MSCVAFRTCVNKPGTEDMVESRRRRRKGTLMFQGKARLGGLVRAFAAVHLHGMMSPVSGHGSSFYTE
ncbi:hypothetical protein CesoFtcFv8_005558 [Champsocephalus esox]|uniref:Uncharacterized protein n=1 Tax=Champsocephalus esox TaxID=159716 RepID=A0AAN8CPV5_9TELE|nr:hypothetical protein CesoFtcFv8_005558 [Champsocephalus esox]